MNLIFTKRTGEIIQMKESEYKSPLTRLDEQVITTTLPSPPIFSPMTMASTFTPLPTPPTPSPANEFPVATPMHSPPVYHQLGRSLTSSPKPIITVTDTNHLPASPHMAKIHAPIHARPEKVHKIRSLSRKSSSGETSKRAGAENPASWMVYNEYGELVTLDQKSKPIVAEELTVTQALRLVYKTYHAEFKDKMREVLNPLLEGKMTALAEHDDPDPITYRKVFTDQLSTWIFSPSPDPRSRPTLPVDMSPEDEARHKVPVYSGPPRVLDIGCADGKWCERIKTQYPHWIVEGVDEVDRWSDSWEGSMPRDFMEPLPGANIDDYFGNVHRGQTQPEFTCRNINQLLSHEFPVPQNLYSLIRGRDVFDRVESYKNFLEDIRHLLQPSGVVEFVEVDPRPRCNYVGRRHSTSEHRSGAETDWTDRIADRFKDPYDAQLATNVPGWNERVAERLKASLRPRDGVPAAKIKGWLQGAGFWDVKQVVIRLPIGGTTISGQRLRDLMIQELEIENAVPILAAKLPEIDLADLSFGNFYLNLHVVTARKPKFPRPGDLLMDGTRQETTEFKYEKPVGRTNETKNGVLGSGLLTDAIDKGSGWKRYSNDMVSTLVAPFTPLPKDGQVEQIPSSYSE